MGNRKQIQRMLFEELKRIRDVGHLGRSAKTVGLLAAGWITPYVAVDFQHYGEYVLTQKAVNFINDFSALEHEARDRKVAKRRSV